jgi:hypothetical protein
VTQHVVMYKNFRGRWCRSSIQPVKDGCIAALRACMRASRRYDGNRYVVRISGKIDPVSGAPYGKYECSGVFFCGKRVSK